MSFISKVCNLRNEVRIIIFSKIFCYRKFFVNIRISITCYYTIKRAFNLAPGLAIVSKYADSVDTLIGSKGLTGALSTCESCDSPNIV